jgi:phosphopantetheinyl transferase (holo-ACP synthase)
VAPGVVGNDVVDLGDPANAGAHRRARLVARVCGGPEREAIARSCDPTALFWSFFAAKEAAFKLASKLGARPVFAHRRFEVDASLSSVSHDGRAFRLAVDRDSDRLHVVAWVGGERPLAVVAEVDPTGDAGLAVRRLVVTTLARRLGCSPSTLAIVRDPEPAAWDDLGPPRLLRGGLPMVGDLSLSHDGRFVAFAASLSRRPATSPGAGAGAGR